MVSVGPKLESNRLALEVTVPFVIMSISHYVLITRCLFEPLYAQIGYAPCVSVADGLAVCQSLLASLVASEPGFAFSGTGSGPRDTLGGAGSATGIGSPSLPFPDPLMFNAKTSPFLNYSTAYSPSLFAKFSLADEFSLRHLAAQYAATFFAQQLATSEL